MHFSLTEFKAKLVFVDGCFVSERLDFETVAPGLVFERKMVFSFIITRLTTAGTKFGYKGTKPNAKF